MRSARSGREELAVRPATFWWAWRLLGLPSLAFTAIHNQGAHKNASKRVNNSAKHLARGMIGRGAPAARWLAA